jgi:hypothetical protein
MESKDNRHIYVCQTLRTMGLDFDQHQSESFSVDGDQWRVHWPGEDPDVLRMTFRQCVSAGYAGDMAIRFAWPLQSAGFIVVVDAGYFEPKSKK